MSVDRLIDVQMCRPEISDVNLCRPGVKVASLKEIIGSQNYEKLFNKPSINGVTIIGDMSSMDLEIPSLKIDTTANWETRTDYVPPEGEIVVYSDKFLGSDGSTLIPAIKIGDGMAYVVDLPFLSDETRDLLADHINNTIVHVTQEDKDAWNEKVTCDATELPSGEYNLIFTRSRLEEINQNG